MTAENTRGVVAQTYHELQAIHVLEHAALAYPLEPASPESAVRAIFQCAELSLLNMQDLLRRSADDIAADNLAGAVVKLSWARGFHKLLLRLSNLPHELGDQVIDANPTNVLRIADSPAYKKFQSATEKLASAIDHHGIAGQLDFELVIADESLESNSFRILHFVRLMFHEHEIWRKNLARVAIPVAVPSYEEFVVTDLMEAAVYDTELTGDTYFMQFRGLHQVPETLGFEINSRLENVILALRKGNLPRAVELMHTANTLSDGVIECLPVIADNLATADYHDIRENLGLTSGSHSVAFHYHMFRDLYEQLAESVNDYLTRSKSHSGAEAVTLEDVMRESAAARFTEPHAFQIHMLITECLKFRIFTRNWRSMHLHLPRNNLGGKHTKSLTGSKDAISAVKRMYYAARKRDPFTKFARARAASGIDEFETSEDQPENAMSKLDDQLLEITGGITKRRFTAVQERTGVFAMGCPFSVPPKRSVK